MKHPVIGLALGSGGARGLSHIGVIKALEENGIPIHMIAGTSIGALVGAYYAANPKAEKIEQLAYEFSTKRAFDMFDLSLRGGFIKGEKIEKTITEILNDATFSSLRIPLAIVATDFNTGEKVVIKKGNLVKAIRTSISVPAFLQPLQYEGTVLADGGLSDPVPTDVLYEMGADIVIAVNLDTVYVEKDISKIPSLSSIPMRSVNILRHHLALQTSKAADVVISPKVYQVGLIGWSHFFDKEKIEELIQEGERATALVLPTLKNSIVLKEGEKNIFKRIMKVFTKWS